MTDTNIRQPAHWSEHERVTAVTGRRSGIPLIAAVHSTALGPATGGSRMWRYGSWSDAYNDALDLSAAMTKKNAAAGLEAGGGKLVIVLDDAPFSAERRRDLLLDVGDLVEEFGGSYRTGEDVGTTADDMRIIRERTPHVLGLPADMGGSGEPSEPTATGVLAALDAALAHRFGTTDASGIRVNIVGLGQVGSRIAERLALRGASLLVGDINPEKRAFADAIGAQWWDGPEQLLSAPADVLVPAGLGGLLTPSVISALNVKIVVGPANNPLSETDDAELLARRGILYVPDYVANAGGVVYTTLVSDGVAEDLAMERVVSIGETVTHILDEARLTGKLPLDVADDLVRHRLTGRER